MKNKEEKGGRHDNVIKGGRQRKHKEKKKRKCLKIRGRKIYPRKEDGREKNKEE